MIGVSRFDCYPSDFLNGIIGLTADQISVYTVVMMLQYDRGKAVVYAGRERELGVRAGMSRGRLAKAVSDLVALGKVSLAEGVLSNGRTVRELEKISEKFAKNAENSEKGGNATREKWGHILNYNNGEARPVGMPTGTPKQGPIPSPSPSPVDRDLSVSCPKRVRTKAAYSDKFARFWLAYPTDPNMSKKLAAAEWTRLSEEDQDAAIGALTAFKTHCANLKDYRMLHACRYLSQRRFEGHLETAGKVAEQVFVKIGSAQWRAWEQWYDLAHGKRPPVNKEGSGWWFKSEWPPNGERKIA